MSEKPEWVMRYEQEKGVEVEEGSFLASDFFWLPGQEPRFALNQEGQVLALANFDWDADVFRSGSWSFVKRVVLSQEQVERGHFRTRFEALEAVIVTHFQGEKLTERLLKPLQPYKKIGWIHSKLSDLAGLSTRTDLEALWLHDNQIQDLSPLKALSSLQTLSLNSNQIQDLSPLKALSSLQALGLSNNRIQDLSPLKALSSPQTLNLGSNQIQDLSPLKALSSLQKLDLDRNQIQDLSPLKALSSLQKLDLDRNQIQDLSPLKALSSLQTLWLNSNQIQDLSPLKALSSLQTLWLDNNQIQDLSPLKALSSLQTLWLNSNQIQDLSPLKALSSLQSLVLDDNRIQDLSPLKALSSLQALGLDRNQIQDLSPLKALSSLQKLDLGRNQIQDLSPLKALSSLQILGLSYNRIQDLSPLKALSSLQYLDIGGNPIQTPPLEIARRGLDAIRDYLRQLDSKGAVPLYEAKILVVGEPGAGKTSLIGKLFDPDFRVPDDTRSTLGIQIHRDWCFPLPKKPEVSFKAHLWDFGGQEIQYLTHQFFLQSRSLFLLVIENRKEHEHADYWFQILSLLGQGSPVLVIFNERDGVAIDNFDLANYRRLFDQMPILDQSLNLAEAPDARFEAMRQLVQKKVSELKQIGQPIPLSWLKVRGTLEASKQKKLAWSEFAELCREEGLTEAESQRNLAIYLHDLGALVFFHDDPELSQSLFLDPQWLADAVYAILGDKSLKESNGRFSKEWMFAQWSRHGIEGGDCNLLLRLMLKNGFELCYPLEGDKGQEYLAPQLLKNIRPELPERGKPTLCLRFHYKFMPKGIIARMIVLLADDLAKGKSGADLVWWRGFALARPASEVEALVEEIERNKGGKAIDIRLWGPSYECQDLLGHIHELLRGIHRRSFAGLELDAHVPIPSNPDYDIPLSFLRSLQKKGVQSQHFVGSDEPLEIAPLLQGMSLIGQVAKEDGKANLERQGEGYWTSKDQVKLPEVKPNLPLSWWQKMKAIFWKGDEFYKQLVAWSRIFLVLLAAIWILWKFFGS